MKNLDRILAEPKITHDLVQGSDEWHQFRLEHDGSSEAAAMLGLSKKVKRTELLHRKHTGIAREFSAWVQENILDYGHEVEALARPHVETLIGEDLYPVTCSRGRISASCDGLSLDDRRAFEHKQWAEELAAMVQAGVVPDEHMPQCQQILMVTGAEELFFVVSDGTPEKMVWAKVTPDRFWWDRLADGWAQFQDDLASYVPSTEPVAPKVVAEPVQELPAVVLKVSGEVALQENFKVFEKRLRDFLDNQLIRQPKTDQDFADLDAQIKAMKKAEEALNSAEAQMLAQIDPVEQARKTKAMLLQLVKENRIMAEKLLSAEKDRRKAEIVAAGTAALRSHIEGLNQRLGKAYMPPVAADFGGVIKGLKSLASMEDRVSTELARAKIEANRVADAITINLAHLAKHAEYSHLFPDERFLVLKAPEDFAAAVAARIAADKQRQETERERIRREEAGRVEQAAKAEAERRAQEEARAGRHREDEAARAQRQSESVAPLQAPQREAANTEAAAANVVPLRQQPPAGNPTLRLGIINERLAGICKVTAEDLLALGFPAAARQGSAVLYHETQWPEILNALIRRLTSLRDGLKAAA